VNNGTATEPSFEERPLPVEGKVDSLRLPHPRATDCNNDGLIDLIVSTGSDILIYPNVGSLTAPIFDIRGKPIRSAWGNSPVRADHQMLDWNNDGWPDLVSRYVIHLNAKVGKPYFWTKTVSVLSDGMNIDHPVELGDGHFYSRLHDLDGDGKIDVLFGDWHGNVWFHRNQGTDQEKTFDEQGLKLQTSDNEDIKVGPIGGDTNNDFQALQGARTTLVAGDYNGDGLDDLIVGDTYGKVRHYKNIGPRESPRFAPPETIADLKSRLDVEKADWDRDGRLDVIVSASNHKINLLLNEGSAEKAQFGEPTPLDIEIKGPIAMVADLNRDGDDDLLVNGTQGTTFVERSFIEHGYAPAHIVEVESRTKERKE
jgi:hypothetical protein